MLKNEKLLEYSIQLAYLKRLLDENLITEAEYTKVKNRLKRDYHILSEITT